MKAFSYVETVADTTVLLRESDWRGMRESDRFNVLAYGAGSAQVKTRAIEGSVEEKVHAAALSGDGIWVDGNFAEVEVIVTGTVDLRITGWEAA